jgi:thioredoxin-like negative regulator of GroEL
MKSNQYQRVKDLLHKYTIIQPSNAQVFCLMAEILQRTNDVEHAKSWLVNTRRKKNPHFRFDYFKIEFSGIYKH